MDQQQLSKVDSAVQECFDACRETHTPFTQLSAWLERLKGDPDWSDAELLDFQMRVIRMLL